MQRGASETGSASSQVLAAAQSLSGDSNRLKHEVGRFLTGAGGLIPLTMWIRSRLLDAGLATAEDPIETNQKRKLPSGSLLFGCTRSGKHP